MESTINHSDLRFMPIYGSEYGNQSVKGSTVFINAPRPDCGLLEVYFNTGIISTPGSCWGLQGEYNIETIYNSYVFQPEMAFHYEAAWVLRVWLDPRGFCDQKTDPQWEGLKKPEIRQAAEYD